MSHDPEVTARIDHLLRTDPRLSAAAPLIGRIPAVVSEPKPPRAPRSKKAKKRPPPRMGMGSSFEHEPDQFHADSDDESGDDETPAKPTGLPPWLKVARAKVVSEQMRLALGAEALAYVAIDGWLWGQLQTEALRDAALVLAVRGLRWEERESDGADLVKREEAPLQCHADTAGELSELVAALGPDGAEGANSVGATEGLVQVGSRRAMTIAGVLEGLTRERLRTALAAVDLDETRARWSAGRGFEALVDTVFSHLNDASPVTIGVERLAGGRLQHELDRHERLLADARAEFEETDCCDTMHQIDVLEGQVALLRSLLDSKGDGE